MTTEKQIAANRQNAKYSTGPRTEHGKRRSRRNAIRHGLTAETVIAVLEDATDYKAFERAIKADYQLQSSIECELVNRLASLLWRLRRAIKVESGLISIQTAILHGDQRVRSRPNIEPIVDRLSIFPTLVPSLDLENSACGERLSSKDPEADRSEKTQKLNTDHADIARSFLQLANLDSGIFERLSRYETSLWRQTLQILLLLNSINWDAKNACADQRLQLRRPRRKPRRFPPFGLDPFWKPAGRMP